MQVNCCILFKGELDVCFNVDQFGTDGSRYAGGYAVTTPAGVAGTGAAPVGVGAWQRPPSQASSIPAAGTTPLPWWKRRWLLYWGFVMIPICIAFLFILLFPVVRSIVQSVINKASLDVTVASISAPQSDRYTVQ